jgi:hypothetical protein
MIFHKFVDGKEVEREFKIPGIVVGVTPHSIMAKICNEIAMYMINDKFEKEEPDFYIDAYHKISAPYLLVKTRKSIIHNSDLNKSCILTGYNIMTKNVKQFTAMEDNHHIAKFGIIMNDNVAYVGMIDFNTKDEYFEFTPKTFKNAIGFIKSDSLYCVRNDCIYNIDNDSIISLNDFTGTSIESSKFMITKSGEIFTIVNDKIVQLPCIKK